MPASFAPDVVDPLFGLLVGLLDAGAYGRLEHAAVDSLVRSRGGSRMPVEAVVELQRTPAAGGADAQVRVLFAGDLELDIPYSLLGYHPGSIRTTRELRLREWSLGDRPFWLPDQPGGRRIVVEDLRLWMVERGRLELDVDAWLDKLFGPRLDDVEITGMLLFRWRGKRWGLGFGYSRGGDGRTGVFDLSGDEMHFPAEEAFLHMGRQMRAEGEARLGASRPRDW